MTNSFRSTSNQRAAPNQGADAPRSPVAYRDCDRFWFLTWTTYGTWLPGDKRGFVSPVPDADTGRRITHNIPGTPYDSDIPAMAEQARANLKCEPIYLVRSQAKEVIEQFHETSLRRNWLLLAAAVMCNHAHIVAGVSGDPEPAGLLRDYKSYASRRLNRRWPKPASGTWWTESGSKRKLPNDDAVIAAANYVKNQPNPLAMWIHEDFN